MEDNSRTQWGLGVYHIKENNIHMIISIIIMI